MILSRLFIYCTQLWYHFGYRFRHGRVYENNLITSVHCRSICQILRVPCTLYGYDATSWSPKETNWRKVPPHKYSSRERVENNQCLSSPLSSQEDLKYLCQNIALSIKSHASYFCTISMMSAPTLVLVILSTYTDDHHRDVNGNLVSICSK